MKAKAFFCREQNHGFIVDIDRANRIYVRATCELCQCIMQVVVFILLLQL